ncbi:MAG: helix-hairpin-helix domain-containing protein [Acidobacteriota bacterium]
MAKAPIRISVADLKLTVVFVIFICAGTFLVSCSRARTANDPESKKPPVETAENAVDINSATAGELEKIPHIGRKLAERIIAHRETHGPFMRPEQLLLVQGISEKSFREIRHLIKTE